MTVIAWDGKYLAADKRCNSGKRITKTTKVFKLSFHIGRQDAYQLLVAYAGTLSVGNQCVEWLKRGAELSEYPALQKDKEFGVDLVVIDSRKPGIVFTYDFVPCPVLHEEKYFAEGSGRDLAIAALYLGQSAVAAVEIASTFDRSCGNGVDSVCFD